MRSSGRTTRLANEAIEELFTNGRCKISDHHFTPESSKRLLGIVFRRLRLEHKESMQHMFFDPDALEIIYNPKKVNRQYVERPHHFKLK